jgi:23S rRNA (cytidine1920-2'-O)/16S rRNA (cytidine1409-2'-O)-methyltransferase
MAANEGVRLDTWLVQNGYAGGREKAKELIAAEYVTVDGRPIKKASFCVTPAMTVVCTAPAQKYVGRGGYKLEKALALDGVSVDGAMCMDVGASTGGFTDCMLQGGASHVYAVDVGHDQLHPSLRADSRVTMLEGTDIRGEELKSAIPAGSVTFCSVDVSFVSLTHILPSVLPYLAKDATLVCLIKPQFEAGVGGIGKHGVVKDRKVHARVLSAQLCLFAEQGLAPVWLGHSPITGGEGNIEYLAVLRRNVPTVPVWDVTAVVQTAFEQLK